MPDLRENCRAIFHPAIPLEAPRDDGGVPGRGVFGIGSLSPAAAAQATKLETLPPPRLPMRPSAGAVPVTAPELGTRHLPPAPVFGTRSPFHPAFDRSIDAHDIADPPGRGRRPGRRHVGSCVRAWASFFMRRTAPNTRPNMPKRTDILHDPHNRRGADTFHRPVLRVSTYSGTQAVKTLKGRRATESCLVNSNSRLRSSIDRILEAVCAACHTAKASRPRTSTPRESSPHSSLPPEKGATPTPLLPTNGGADGASTSAPLIAPADGRTLGQVRAIEIHRQGQGRGHRYGRGPPAVSARRLGRIEVAPRLCDSPMPRALMKKYKGTVQRPRYAQHPGEC